MSIIAVVDGPDTEPANRLLKRKERILEWESAPMLGKILMFYPYYYYLLFAMAHQSKQWVLVVLSHRELWIRINKSSTIYQRIINHISTISVWISVLGSLSGATCIYLSMAAPNCELDKRGRPVVDVKQWQTMHWLWKVFVWMITFCVRDESHIPNDSWCERSMS